jgi:hypothetical protein
MHMVAIKFRVRLGLRFQKVRFKNVRFENVTFKNIVKRLARSSFCISNHSLSFKIMRMQKASPYLGFENIDFLCFQIAIFVKCNPKRSIFFDLV